MMVAWIQGEGGLWWKDPEWDGPDTGDGPEWTMVLDNWCDLVIRARRGVAVRKAVPWVKNVKSTDDYACLPGYRAYTCQSRGPVPEADRGKKMGVYPGRCIDWCISITEEEAIMLWQPGFFSQVIRLKEWFGTIGVAKRACRRAFRLQGKVPVGSGSTGSIWVGKRGETY